MRNLIYLLENKCIELKYNKKRIAKDSDTEKQSRQKLKMRKPLEVTISNIKKCFLEQYILLLTLKVF